jgi:acyl-CoA synthetase (AMP-forming)/AMP-acid ligase II
MHVGMFLAKAAARFPEQVSVVSGSVGLTNRELLHRVYRVANALLGLGLEKGDRVALLFNNCHQALESFFGIVCAGLVVVPMNARNSLKEHLYVLSHSGSRAIIAGGEFAQEVHSVVSEVPDLAHGICATGTASHAMMDYEALLAKSSNVEPSLAIDENDIISLRYTSGTTGHPKGVLHDHKSNVAILYNLLIDDFRIEKGDTIALPGPITHASGFMILPHLLRGGRVVLLPGFDATQMLEVVQKEKVTSLYLVPTMIAMLLAHPDNQVYDLRSLKTIRYGASPISPSVLTRGIERFGNIFVQAYGLTEGGMLLTLLSKEDHILDGSEQTLRKIRSVGREVTSVRVAIMDENNTILPSNTEGEIVVQSEQNMRGYLQDSEATAKALRGGWLHTRDMGYIDEEGYIYLLDRKEDMIISGGFNVYPREVEDALLSHPAVLEAAVFGMPDDIWGEAVKAVVSLKPGMVANEEELITHCKENLASFKKPKSIDFRSELPKSSYGKILRRKLREPYWSGRERRIN